MPDHYQSKSTSTDSEWHEPGKQCLLCMIVEDEAVISIALEDEFTDAGYEVVGPFATCAAAVESLKLRTPAVAVLDTVLKDGSCVELARQLRQIGIPFVIYSGKEKRFESAPEFDGAPWVIKPSYHIDVVKVVDGLVGR